METRPIDASLPHAYPFRFVDAVLQTPPAESRSDGASERVSWEGRVSARISANDRASMGASWASPLLLAEAIAQAALLLEARGAEAARRGYLAGIDSFHATRPPRPGESLAITVKLTARWGAIVKFEGEVRSDEEIVARGAVLVQRGGGSPAARIR